MSNPDALDIPYDVLDKAFAYANAHSSHTGFPYAWRRPFVQSVITQLGLVRGDVAAFIERERERDAWWSAMRFAEKDLLAFRSPNDVDQMRYERDRRYPALPDPRLPAKPRSVTLSTGEWMRHPDGGWKRRTGEWYRNGPPCATIADCDTLRAFLEAEREAK